MNEKRKVMVCEAYKELCTDGRCPSFEKFKDKRTGAIPQCRHWLELAFKNDTTGQEEIIGDCDQAWIPTLLVDVIKKTIGTTAAVESFRNEMVQLSARALLLERK